MGDSNMDKENYSTAINQQKINNDIVLHQSVMRELFDCGQMKYTTKDFYSLVNNNDIQINRNTFYSNCSGLEKDYCNFHYKRLDKKIPLATDIYCLRLEKYFLLVNEMHNSKSTYNDREKKAENTFLSRILVTKNFFPLYIALISSNSKNSNWEHMSESIKSLYTQFFAPFEKGQLKGSFGTLDYEKAHEFYSYCLDLLIPDKLYQLICKVENVLSKENGQPTEVALKHNLNLFIDAAASTLYFNKTIQNEFLSYSNYIFDEFCKNRKKGIFYTANSSTDSIPSMHIAYDLTGKLENFKKYLNEEWGMMPLA